MPLSKISEVDKRTQEKLKNARVLCIGAGGLGSPALLYLAAAGVGKLGIIDDDRVERSNLQRQIAHSEATLGWRKVDSAQATLQALNAEVRVKTYAQRLTVENARRIIAEYDVVIDGSDNYASRYLISDVCGELDRPHVYGAVHEFLGQVAVFWPSQSPQAPCYRCLYPEEDIAEAANCATHGVLGMLPGIIGTLQATEALKLVLKCGEPLIQHLLIYEALPSRLKKLSIEADRHCRHAS